jgi:hypothetical protein
VTIVTTSVNLFSMEKRRGGSRKEGIEKDEGKKRK